jgi:5-formyltetrahydrofolate cyclo-ligase
MNPPSNPLSDTQKTLRQTVRAELIQRRKAFEQSPDYPAANQALSEHLRTLLHRTQPTSLGVYWYLPGEFNAVAALLSDSSLSQLQLALPFAKRNPRHMHYRTWNRQPPTQRDECRIPSSDGEPITPQLVLVPCLGYTPDHFRLGWGGGYFDRWLAENSGTTAIGIAWSCTELQPQEFEPQAHDFRLNGVLTELGFLPNQAAWQQS